MKLSNKTVIVLFFIVGISILGRVIFNSFVGDDSGYFSHPYIQNFRIDKLFLGSSADLGGTSPVTGQFYRPLMLAMFSLIYLVFGKTALFYHLFQLIIHITNAIFIYFLLKKFTENLKAFILSLLFMLHPINVEALAYISNFQDVLFMFFGLMALLYLVRKKESLINFLVVLVLIFCSLLSKETGILFVALSVAYLFLIKKSRNALYYFSLFGLLMFYIFFRFGFAKVGFTNIVLSPIGHLSIIDRIYLIPEIFSYYLFTFIFPVQLAIGQVWARTNSIYSNLALPAIFLSFITIATFSILFLRTDKKRCYEFIFFAIWFVAGLLLHLQFFPLEMTVADRWFYFPFVGLLGMVAVILKKRVTSHRNKYILLTIVALILSILAIRSFIRLGDWKDAITLYSHDAKVTKSYLLEHSLGYELMQIGKMDEAFMHLSKSVDLYKTPFNTNSMGVYYYKKEDLPKALLWFRKSISLGDYFLAYQNYARLSITNKEYNNSILVLNKATKKFPKSDIFYYLLSIAEYKNGNVKSALEAAISAYNISPNKQNEYVFHQLLNGEKIIIND